MAEPVRKVDPDDIVLWPDGTTCFVHERHEYNHKSDDYEIVPFNTPRWRELEDGGVTQGKK